MVRYDLRSARAIPVGGLAVEVWCPMSRAQLACAPKKMFLGLCVPHILDMCNIRLEAGSDTKRLADR